MIRRPLIILILSFILILFIIFNMTGKSTINFIFTEIQNVPTGLVMILSFFAGSFFTFYLFLRSIRHKKKLQKEKKKAEKAEAKEEEAEEKK